MIYSDKQKDRINRHLNINFSELIDYFNKPLISNFIYQKVFRETKRESIDSHL